MKKDHNCKWPMSSRKERHGAFLTLIQSLALRYHADPSGTFVRYDAKAIGSGSEGAQGELQDKYKKVGVVESIPSMLHLTMLIYPIFDTGHVAK